MSDKQYNRKPPGRGKIVGRRFICNETGEVFTSITECARVMGLNKGAIRSILYHEGRNKHKGYSFKFIDPPTEED